MKSCFPTIHWSLSFYRIGTSLFSVFEFVYFTSLVMSFVGVGNAGVVFALDEESFLDFMGLPGAFRLDRTF